MSAFKNEDRIAAIDTLTNKVIATSPIGQAPQAVVYVPNAIPVVSNHGAEVPGRTGRDHQIAALHFVLTAHERPDRSDRVDDRRAGWISHEAL
jgi:YVTN family beta-propeller protein